MRPQAPCAAVCLSPSFVCHGVHAKRVLLLLVACLIQCFPFVIPSEQMRRQKGCVWNRRTNPETIRIAGRWTCLSFLEASIGVAPRPKQRWVFQNVRRLDRKKRLAIPPTRFVCFRDTSVGHIRVGPLRGCGTISSCSRSPPSRQAPSCYWSSSSLSAAHCVWRAGMTPCSHPLPLHLNSRACGFPNFQIHSLLSIFWPSLCCLTTFRA
jgi:hypothetical protein